MRITKLSFEVEGFLGLACKLEIFVAFTFTIKHNSNLFMPDAPACQADPSSST